MKKQRRLTAAQKVMAEQAMGLVPAAVRAFVAKHMCYARLLPRCDLVSVAQMAVCEASFTYDPAKSKPTTYYGTAIRHALLKEVRRLQRSRDCANERVDISTALTMKFTIDQRQRAIECLLAMPPEDRELIEAYVIEGKSLNSLGQRYGRDWRTVKQRLLRALERLRHAVDSGSTCVPAGTPCPSPPAPAEPPVGTTAGRACGASCKAACSRSPRCGRKKARSPASQPSRRASPAPADRR